MTGLNVISHSFIAEYFKAKELRKIRGIRPLIRRCISKWWDQEFRSFSKYGLRNIEFWLSAKSISSKYKNKKKTIMVHYINYIALLRFFRKQKFYNWVNNYVTSGKINSKFQTLCIEV